jgi:DNA-binding LacI/PurR family transcriptional regulator
MKWKSISKFVTEIFRSAIKLKKLSMFVSMSQRRITIYDIAKELGIAASAVSKALNNQKGVSSKVRDLILNKASELKYKHNLHAANLRHGKSRTLGVIVPHLSHNFFSGAIAGIEDACFENDHRLIICQSHDVYEKEKRAVQTLIHQNVDCLLISVSSETLEDEHLLEVLSNNIHLVQFDRVLNNIASDKVLNDNRQASYLATKSLIDSGYNRIGFLGGASSLSNYVERKEGYIEALNHAGIEAASELIFENILSKEAAYSKAVDLLNSATRPDAIFAVSDLQALAVLQAAKAVGLKVPEQLGILGFSNESFAEILSPSLSSIDQKSWRIGYEAASLYFNRKDDTSEDTLVKVVDCELKLRESSSRPI